jgi:hypothetical protein
MKMECEIIKDKKLLEEIMMPASQKFSSLYRESIENYRLIIIQTSSISMRHFC